MGEAFQITNSVLEDIEKVRWQRSEGEPDPRPPFFDERYVLPAHREKLLQTKFVHERDKEIVFYEEPHIYLVKGFPADTSVSSLASDFEEKFDPQLAINAMKKKLWPRLQYTTGSKKVTSIDDFCLTVQQGCLFHDPQTDTTVASIGPAATEDSAADGIIVHTVLKDTLAPNTLKNLERLEWYVFERSMTDDEIKAAWDLNGLFARNLGTEAHLQMELWSNSEPCRLDDPEVKCGIRFIYEQLLPLGAKVFRTEWEIFGEEEDVAGCIDLAVLLPDGCMFLVDWKRSLKLSSKIHGYSKMHEPLDHIDSCSGSEYAIQLSAYQYIIEKYYGFKVVGRALASLHPDAPYNTFIPYLENEIEYIMARRRHFVTARTLAEKDEKHAHLCCTKTKRLMTDAVRSKQDGSLYTRKAAQLHFIDCEDCPETSKACNAVIQEYMKPVPDLTKKIPWRMRIPKGGFPVLRRDDE